MRNWFYAMAAVLVLEPAAVSAADDFITGVYLASEELCATARQESLQKVIEDSNLILSERGLDALEYNCAFVQVSKHPRQEKAWLVTAICEEPGLMSPDVLSIVERQAGQLEVSSLAEGGGDQEGGLTGTYHYCEGVPLP